VCHWLLLKRLAFGEFGERFMQVEVIRYPLPQCRTFEMEPLLA
jgi:hypothetical protein